MTPGLPSILDYAPTLAQWSDAAFGVLGAAAVAALWLFYEFRRSRAPHPAAPPAGLTTVPSTRSNVAADAQLFRHVVESAADAIMVFDRDWRVAAWNQAALRLLARAESEIASLSVSDILHPAELDAAVASSPREGVTLRRRDGHTVPADITAARVDSGATIVIARDATARSRREESLAGSNRVLVSTLDALASQVAILDLSGRVTAVNAAFRRSRLVWSPSKPLREGDSYLAACEQCVAAGGPLATDAAAVASGIRDVAAGRITEFAYEAATGAPDEAFSVVHVTRSTGGDEPLIVVAHTDVTAMRQAERSRDAERRFVSAVIDTVGALVIVLDRDGRIVRFNNACVRSTGFAPQEVVGRILWDVLIPTDDISRIRDAFFRLRDGAAPRPVENHWVGKHGQMPLIAWSNTVLRNPEGQVQYVIGTGIDITDRRRIEQELVQAQKMKAVGQLAGGIAHDFNNLLTAIFGHTALAKRTLPEGHPAVNSLDRVEHAAEQAGRVVRSLLTFSRRESGEKRPILLGQIVDESTKLIAGTLSTSIRLQAPKPDGDLWIIGDRHQLEHAILNLAINARDAMPLGGALRIAAEAGGSPNADVEPGPAGWVRLVVSDTGVGMSREVLARATEPFFTTKPAGQGTGLGLSIVQSIIRDHRGVVNIKSEPGKGTTVELWLPAHTAPVPRTGAITPVDRGAVVVVATPRHYAREIIATTLRQHGYLVEQAADADSAARALASDPSTKRRVLLLDASLANDHLTGLLARLRDAAPDSPAIIFAAPDANLDITEDHATFILREPFTMNTLAQRVDHALATPKPATQGP